MFERLRVLTCRFRGLWTQRQVDDDFTQELETHLAMLVDDNLRRGKTADQARRAARMRLGRISQLRETQRELQGLPLVETIVADVRYGLRALRRNLSFAAVAVLTLALGIASNTVIFSAVYTVLLRALPYPQPEQLVAVWSRDLRTSEPAYVSAADFFDWRSQAQVFQALAAYANWPLNLTKVDEPRRLQTQLVTANLFATLGVRAQMGRTFMPGEDRDTSTSVVVISNHLWHVLGQSPTIVGRQLTLNGSPATVIGVMPDGFAFPSPETDAWVPLTLSAKNRSNREGRWLAVIGRLKPSATRREATAQLEAVTARLAVAFPASNAGWGASLVPMRDELVGNMRPILVTLQVGGLLLLLIASANLANLLLAQAAARRREIELRVVVGASRRRIWQQLIAETTVLALLGGISGVALSAVGTLLVKSFGAGLIPGLEDIRLSTPVVLFGLGATAVTGFLCGTAPVLYATRADFQTLNRFGASSTPSVVERQRGVLVAVEIALACVLLVASSLLGKSLMRLLGTPPGVRTDHMLTVRLTLPHAKYPTDAAQAAFFQQVLDRTRALPGVIDAGEVSDAPLNGNNPTFEFILPEVRVRVQAPVQAGLRMISPGYLQTSAIPLRNGRDFDTHDRIGQPPVAIVNETMARRYWPDSDPLGKTLRVKNDNHWMTVVGVVNDVKQIALQTDEGPVVYIPYAQKAEDWMTWATLMVRTAGDPLDCVPAVEHAVHQVDEDQPVAEIRTLREALARSTALPRFTTLVSLGISGFALVISAVGVFGLLMYTVVRRMPELGVRRALGASSLQLVSALVGQMMLRVCLGVAGGLLSAWWLARLLESILFDVRPRDPGAFLAAAGLLVLTSLGALWVPTQRALRADPMTVLRAE